jgi:hypothetical protein
MLCFAYYLLYVCAVSDLIVEFEFGGDASLLNLS